MNQKKKLVLTVLILALVLTAAAILYPKLSEKYKGAPVLQSPGGETCEFDVLPEASAADERSAEADTAGSTEEEAAAGTSEDSSEKGSSCEDSSDEAVGEDVSDEASEEDVSDEAASEEEVYPAPDFSVLNKLGQTVHFRDLIGKPVVINFWATWCPYCVKELPDYEACYQEFGDQVEFMFIDLTDGSRETIKTADAYIRKNGFTFPVYYDTEMSAAYVYGIQSIPVSVFIDEKGNLYRWGTGMLDGTVIHDTIEALAGGAE